VGLLASATFLIVATATNTKDLRRADVTRRDSGAGGFALQAVSSVPLPFDPATPTGRANLGFSAEDEAALSGVTVVSFLASPGEDISCLNLARPASPRILGVPLAMVERGGFTVAVPGAARSPWTLLDEPLPDGVVPAFGDAASVQWTLHSGLGRAYAVPAGRLRFVGLLQGSLFARELLVSETSFRRLFPSITAPSCFLIETPPGREDQVAEVLRRNLGDMGLQVRRSGEVLNDFVRVQNTYLSVFLTLGGLGLLLGTVGLGVTLVRNAAERRRELALLSAIGFSQRAVAGTLMMENEALLVGGLLWGTLTALVAVLPHLASEHFHANWMALLSVLSAVLVVGLATCLAAVWAVLRADLVPALRQE
jgi:putative ABC transport system permease protein